MDTPELGAHVYIDVVSALNATEPATPAVSARTKGDRQVETARPGNGFTSKTNKKMVFYRWSMSPFHIHMYNTILKG
jgi:hypothetical protein